MTTTADLSFPPETWRPFAKFILPALLSVVAAGAYALIAGHLDTAQMEVALVGLAGSVVAFLTTNGPAGVQRFAKAIAASVLALATVLIHALVTTGWDPTETRLAATGLVTAVLVYLVPNADLFMPTSDERAPQDLGVDPVVPPGLQA
jgi:hypothetical protein